MAIPIRRSHAGTFFVTSRTHLFRRVFQVERNAELFIEMLQHYRREGHYRLHAFVAMPDHIHLIVTPTETLERTMSLIKGGFSYRLASKGPVWQRGYTDHRLLDRGDYQVRLGYLIENPVKAGLVASAEEYPYSSAYRRPIGTDLSG